MQRFMVPARLVARSVAALSVLLLFPAAGFAQAAITGVVKDASGGVLPGVTVEVASPVLIEKARSVTTDGTGQYRVVDLRPGTYSVTVSLAGFKTVKREGVELTGTICGHGERRSERRRAGGIGDRQRSITDRRRPERAGAADGEHGCDRRHPQLAERFRDPVLDSRTERVAGGCRGRWWRSGGIAGGIGGLAGTIHGGNTYGSRTKTDGLNTDFTGQAIAGGQLLNTAGAVGSGDQRVRRAR